MQGILSLSDCGNPEKCSRCDQSSTFPINYVILSLYDLLLLARYIPSFCQIQNENKQNGCVWGQFVSEHFFFRDASLKLLVVPRDEDILQMAYQNSVYRSGSEPHRGGASEIPEPPPAHRPVPSYAARGRHMSDSVISVHRSKHHPSQQKYKAELRVLPEDGTGGPQV